MVYNNRTTLTVAERMFLFDKLGNVICVRIKTLPDIEYPLFGSPQQKIGNFTKQAKLTGWTPQDCRFESCHTLIIQGKVI